MPLDTTPLDTWDRKIALLDGFQSAIEHRTHGRLTNLSLDVVNGALVLEANSATYHVVQLALAAIQEFAADLPKLTPAKMSFCVNGHPLVLRNPYVQDTNEWTSDDFMDDGHPFANPHGGESSSSRVSPALASVAVG